jgi:hypothetical protein
MAPALFSHLPMFSPVTFKITASRSPAIATPMKYVLLDESPCHDAPPMNSALPAAKYSRPGRYGRLDPQYVQPVRKPANGPNARLLQT